MLCMAKLLAEQGSLVGSGHGKISFPILILYTICMELLRYSVVVRPQHPLKVLKRWLSD